jgi:signal peptidase II
MRRPVLPPWSWAVLVFVVDFITKRVVLANEAVLRGKVEVIGEFARFIYVRNPGAAMGLFPIGRWALVGVSILASVFLVYLYRTLRPRRPVRLAAMSAILGGALGNLVDRLFYDGLVVDFIDLGFGAHRFYTFNVADMGVTLGGALLFLCLLRDGGDDRAAAQPAPDEVRADEAPAGDGAAPASHD